MTALTGADGAEVVASEVLASPFATGDAISRREATGHGLPLVTPVVCSTMAYARAERDRQRLARTPTRLAPTRRRLVGSGTGVGS